jgi:hypothetical protein
MVYQLLKSADLLFVYTLQEMARLDQRMALLEQKLDAMLAAKQANPPPPQMEDEDEEY